jgi:hypothetical protein
MNEKTIEFLGFPFSRDALRRNIRFGLPRGCCLPLFTLQSLGQLFYPLTALEVPSFETSVSRFSLSSKTFIEKDTTLLKVEVRLSD